MAQPRMDVSVHGDEAVLPFLPGSGAEGALTLSANKLLKVDRRPRLGTGAVAGWAPAGPGCGSGASADQPVWDDALGGGRGV